MLIKTFEQFYFIILQVIILLKKNGIYCQNQKILMKVLTYKTNEMNNSFDFSTLQLLYLV